jgi:hypothetical protein
MTDPESRIVERARQALDARARDLDEITSARLRAARLRALDARFASRWRLNWLAVTGLATAALAVVLVTGHLWLRPPAAPSLTVAGLEDLELLSTREHPEFYGDLEFYDWLAHRRHGTG